MLPVFLPRNPRHHDEGNCLLMFGVVSCLFKKGFAPKLRLNRFGDEEGDDVDCEAEQWQRISMEMNIQMVKREWQS